MFSWDDIPGNDNAKLIQYLNNHFNINKDGTTEIRKIYGGRAIDVFNGNNYILLSLNNERTSVYIESDYGRTHRLIAKTENGKLNIYQPQNHLRGWIDIIGFNKTVKLNGVEYINTIDPIIVHNVKRAGIKKKSVDFLGITNTRINNQDGISTAEIDILLIWHSTTRSKHGGGGSRTPQPPERITINTSEPIPAFYPDITIPECYITIYNNSFNPHIQIFVPQNDTIFKTQYQYGNETIIQHHMLGIVDAGAVSLIKTHQWSEPTEKLRFSNDNMIIINTNTSQFNNSDLSIYLFNPYESVQIPNSSYNITEITYINGKEFHPFFYYLIIIVLILSLWIFSNIKGIKI